MNEFLCPGCRRRVLTPSLSFACEECAGYYAIFPWPTSCDLHVIGTGESLQLHCRAHGEVVVRLRTVSAPLQEMLEYSHLHMQGITSVLSWPVTLEQDAQG